MRSVQPSCLRPSRDALVFEFRPFQNADPPALAEIWRSQPAFRGRMQPMSAQLFEVCVFSKQYFDPNGFIVATRDGQPIGFVHVGFGPDSAKAELCQKTGVVHMVMVHANADEASLADQLLKRGEAYLRSCGAERILGGGRRPMSQFYLGLYGGSDLSGVLATDAWQTDLLTRSGYEPIEEVAVLQRDLVSFRPPVSRDQRRLRREVQFKSTNDLPALNWWDAQQLSEQQVVRFELTSRGDDEAWAGVSVWDIEPLSTSWGVSTAGVIDLETIESKRRSGLATFLIAEAIKELKVRGVTMVETHVGLDNEPAITLCQKLGFREIDRGIVYELKSAT